MVSIKLAIFKCGQCDIAQFPVLRTIFCLLHIFAQFIVHRTFSHNLPLSATFCRISCIKIHCITSIHRVNLTWGKLIPWPGASWYRRYAKCLPMGRIDTMTRGELIPWHGVSWYRHYARCLLLDHWGVLIPWLGASWYHDVKRVDTACFEVQNQQALWLVFVTSLS